MKSLKARLRLLTLTTVVSLSAAILLLLLGFTRPVPTRLGEVEVERLSVIGENGKPVLVLAGRGKLPGPSMNGRAFPASVSEGRDALAGMIFFNEAGDEVGGLIYNGIPRDSGYSAVGHLSLDQWKQNQVVAIQYIDNGRTRRAGLQVWDRPTEVTMVPELDRLERLQGATGAVKDSLIAAAGAARTRGESGAPRVFVGSQDRVAQVRLLDTRGRVRARLAVDAQDTPALEFLDEAGVVVARYPQAGR